MAGVKPGLLARLLHRRRAGEDVEPTLESVIAWAVRRGLSRLRGVDRAVSVSPIELDDLLGEVAGSVPIHLVALHLDSDIPQLLLLLPERTAPAADALARSVASVLSADPPHLLPYHRTFASYSAADLDELAWRVSGSVAFRLRLEAGDPAVLYACVEERAARRMTEALAADRDFLGEIRSRIRAAEPAPVDAALLSRTLELKAGREFLLGALLCPPRVQCGSHLLEAVPVSLAAAPDRAALGAAPGVWAEGSCELGGTRLSAWYFFPTADEEEAARTRRSLAGVASCLWRAGARAIGDLLGTPPGEPSVRHATSRSASSMPAVVQLGARLRIGTRLFRVETFMEHAALSRLLRRLAAPATLASTAREPVAIVALCLLASLALLRRQLPSLARSLAPDGDGPMPFGVFADLVTERDLAVILQNYVPGRLAGRSLRGVFWWSEPGVDSRGQSLPRAMSPYFFDEARLVALLPRRAREEWDRDAGALDVTKAEHEELAASLVAGIDRAVARGNLLLSPRARRLLETGVRPAIRARLEAELARLAATGVPFATIGTMTAPQVQRLLARCTTRSICLSLFGAEGEVRLVARHVSATRLRLIHEELAVLKRQLQSGALEAREVAAAKREVEAVARRLIEDYAREQERRSRPLSV